MYQIPKINLIQTGKNIRSLRKHRNLSVSNIQDVFGFNTPNAVYKWECGKNLPTIDNLIVLADLFHVSVDEILAVEGELHYD